MLMNLVLVLTKTGELKKAIDKANWAVNLDGEKNPKVWFRRA